MAFGIGGRGINIVCHNFVISDISETIWILERGIAMRILVIGGSYFYGRVFLMQLPKGHEVTVLNRGTYSMEEFGVTQVTGDRNDKNVLRTLTGDYLSIIHI